MSQPEYSVILTTHNRYELCVKTLESIFAQNPTGEIILVDDGSTDGVPTLAKDWPIRYLRLDRPRPSNDWCSPTRVINCGVQAAQGEFLIINGGEVVHKSPNFINTLLTACASAPDIVAIATVLGETGPQSRDTTVFTGEERPRVYFFSGAVRRAHIMEIGGWDEDFVAPGGDDDDVADRLVHGLKLNPVFVEDAVAIHQWHPVSDFYRGVDPRGPRMYYRKMCDWAEGKIGYIRNIGRPWGQL